MRKIAREIAVSATSIYLHFDNKDHLIHTLMEESIGELHREMRAALESGHGPAERVRLVAEVYVTFGLEHPQEYEVLFMVRPEEMPRYPKEKFRKARIGYEMLADEIHKGVEAAIFEKRDPVSAAYSLWAQLHGIVSVILNRRLDTRVDQNDFIKTSIDTIVDGLLIRDRIPAN